MFAKRHYQAVAQALQDTQPPKENEGILGHDDRLDQWERCRDELADLFKSDNGRFDRGRFVHACEAGSNVRSRTAHLKAAE